MRMILLVCCFGIGIIFEWEADTEQVRLYVVRLPFLARSASSASSPGGAG